MDDDGGMDALFSSFMNEVNSVKTTKMKKLEEKFAGLGSTPEEIVERLTSRASDSAFQVLQISPEASDNEITKQYRRLSVLIHPDKCKLEKAAEAFQVLAKAYADTKDPANSDKFRDVWQEAKARVRKRIEKENKDREKRNEDPIDTQGGDFDREVLLECQKMTTDTQEEAESKNAVYEANLKRMEEAQTESRKKRREEAIEKKQWDKQRDKRVAGWQIFMDKVESKKFKTGHMVGQVGVADRLSQGKREQRKEDDASKPQSGKASVGDMTGYKKEDGYVPMGMEQKWKKEWR
jgi:DnaJ family protein C protein 8